MNPSCSFLSASWSHSPSVTFPSILNLTDSICDRIMNSIASWCCILWCLLSLNRRLIVSESFIRDFKSENSIETKGDQSEYIAIRPSICRWAFLQVCVICMKCDVLLKECRYWPLRIELDLSRLAEKEKEEKSNTNPQRNLFTRLITDKDWSEETTVITGRYFEQWVSSRCRRDHR